MVVAHSLSACAVAKLNERNIFDKIVLLAPALNQKELLRYWFVRSSAKDDISWDNFQDFLNEAEFLTDCEKASRTTKSNIIQSDYFLENKEMDYAEFFSTADNVLHIHGANDADVPLASLNIDFPQKLIVEAGDHDLEKSDVLAEWSGQVLKFLK